MRLACSLVWALAGAASTSASIAAITIRIGVFHIHFFISFCSSFVKTLTRGRKILPKPPVPRRECFHSPRRSNAYLAIDLQSLKQVLCQSAAWSRRAFKDSFKTMTYIDRIVAIRNRDMSSQCRRFGTSIMTGWHKLLIWKGCATVADGRQPDSAVSLPDNRN